jgi:hypothetical protein
VVIVVAVRGGEITAKRERGERGGGRRRRVGGESYSIRDKTQNTCTYNNW